MKLDYSKNNGLIPVIIQNNNTLKVLMLGYMNQEALEKTQKEKKVTFFSRSKQRLWTKGEKSGNILSVINIQKDCDNDTLLIKVIPTGPTCHKGNESCFVDKSEKGFIYNLEAIVNNRIENNFKESYTNSLFQKGINKIAQKVGEEAIELVIESKDSNLELFKNEAADLLYHYLILLRAKKISFEEIEKVLKCRQN